VYIRPILSHAPTSPPALTDLSLFPLSRLPNRFQASISVTPNSELVHHPNTTLRCLTNLSRASEHSPFNIELFEGSHVEETKTCSTLRPLLKHPQSPTDPSDPFLLRPSSTIFVTTESNEAATLDGRWWVPVPSAWSRAVLS
jgi:hypothetical protein